MIPHEDTGYRIQKTEPSSVQQPGQARLFFNEDEQVGVQVVLKVIGGGWRMSC